MNVLLRGTPTLKQLGAFYTPDSTARSLARWAIQTGRERVLEPSIGGGALLKAALARSLTLNPRGKFCAVACDIDRAAIARVRQQFGDGIEFLESDFLALSPEALGSFDVVIANPPFTRNHALGRRRAKLLRKRFAISGPAGLWVHFIVHSMEFLNDGGRLATIVPGSALFTKYGDALITRLCACFREVSLLQLEEKPLWSGGAEERGAVILANGFKLGSVAKCDKGVWHSEQSARLAAEAPMPDVYCRLQAQSHVFSHIADLSIGLVTGCNRVFLLSELERKQIGLPHSCLQPIVSRARHIRGLRISRKHLANLASRGEKTWLLAPRNLRGKPTRERLKEITKAQLRTTAWFKKRTPWWKVDPGPAFDAVFTYMNDRGPRLAFVEQGVLCTNTLHRVIFRSNTTESECVGAVLTFLSTFGQLAAEQTGRVYGGGLLKFELGDARNFPILAATKTMSKSQTKKLDSLLRSGDYDGATSLADELLLKSYLGKDWKSELSELQTELARRRSARHSGRALVRSP